MKEEILPVTGSDFPIWPVLSGVAVGGVVTAMILSNDDDPETENRPPSALCSDVSLPLNGNTVTIDASQINNGSFDSDGDNISLAISENTFMCDNVGDNLVVLTVTDGENQVNECTATVSIIDDEAPSVSCTDVTLAYTGNSISITEMNVVFLSDDNCGVSEIHLLPTAVQEIGDHEITVTAIDFAGNESTCIAIVSIVGNLPPVVICNDITLSLDDAGGVSFEVDDVVSENYDEDGSIADLFVSENSFSCDDVGVQTITVTTIDNEGAQATCDAIVTVVDDINPIANCNDLILPYTGEVIQLDAETINNASMDNCGIEEISIAPTTVDNPGVYDVVLTVIDVNGNESNCTSVITVIDNNPPEAICADITIEVNEQGFISIIPTDVDDGSNDSDGAIETSELSQSLFTCEDIGENQITLTITDNQSATDFCFSTVTVVDVIDPEISCEDITLNLPENGTITITESDLSIVTSDNCNVASLVIEPETITGIGEFEVSATVVDESGNSSNCTSIVTILDDIDPEIECQDIEVFLDENGMVSIVAQDVISSVSDNDEVFSVSVSETTFSCDDIGSNTMEVTVEDASGNSSSCTAIVTVTDNVDPIIDCVPFLITLDFSGSPVSLTSTNLIDNVTDNCNVNNIQISQSEFTMNHLGENDVILTVEDDAGNMGECTSVVTVLQQDFPDFIAIDDAAFSPCNVDVIISALNNDLNATNAAILSISDVPDNISVEITNNSLVISGFSIEDFTFIYLAEDEFGQTDEATVTVLISLVEVLSIDDVFEMDFNSPATFAPLENDEGIGLSIGDVQLTEGVADWNFDVNTITISSVGEDVDQLVFNYSAVDECGFETNGQITVIIEVPTLTAVEDQVSISCNEATIIPVLDNDEGQIVEITSVDNVPDNVSVEIIDDAISVTIEPSFTDPIFQFDYTILDSFGASSTTSVIVTVALDELILNDDTIEVIAGDNSFILNPIANDELPNAEMDVTFVLNGYTLEQVGLDLVFTFDEVICEELSIEYTVQGDCIPIASANILVSVLPNEIEAIEDQAVTFSGETVLIQPLFNDIGNSLQIVSITQPTNGQSTLSENNVLYIPNDGFSGFDSFEYVIEDLCGQQTTGVVQITIEAPSCDYTFDLNTTNSVCNLPIGTAALTITPTGNFNVTWSSGETGYIANQLIPDDHNFIAINTDDNCQLVGNFTIENEDPVFGAMVSTQNQICNAPGSITLDVVVEPGAEVVLDILENGSPIDGGSYTVSQTVTFDIPGSGDFTYEFWSPNIGPTCIQSGSFSIMQDQTILNVVVTDQQQPSGPGNNDGLIAVSVTNATAFPVTYLLNGMPFVSSESTFTFNNLVANSYEIVVIDNNNCGSVPINVTLVEAAAKNKIITFSITGNQYVPKTKPQRFEQPGTINSLDYFTIESWNLF